MKNHIIITLATICIFSGSLVYSQESSDELSKQVANPVADLLSFPFQNNTNFNYGTYNRNTNVLNIQPVIPFLKGKLITRTIFPIVSIPDFDNESGMQTTGLGDIVFTTFYAPEAKSLTWGIGPVLELPTGGETRGSQKLSIGPSLVMLAQPGPWTFGGIVNNTWSVAGNDSRADVNHMLLNLFIVRQLGEGWYLNSAPILTADWTADKEDRWIIPVGAGGGKLVFFGGKVPVNLQSQIYYNVVRPDFGPKWQLRLQAQLLLPKSIFTRK